MIKELISRGAEVNAKEKINVLNKMLLENKYLNPAVDPNEMKFFLPKFLTATDWSKENLSDTLVKIDALSAENNEQIVVNS